MDITKRISSVSSYISQCFQNNDRIWTFNSTDAFITVKQHKNKNNS